MLVLVQTLDAKPKTNADYDDLNGMGLAKLKSVTGRASMVGGNTDIMLHRKVRENWKDLCAAFKRAADKEGELSPRALKRVLAGFNIVMARPPPSTRRSLLYGERGY